MGEVLLLLLDNDRPHKGLRTMEAITKLRWTLLPRLAPSDYHLFGKRKESIRGRKSEDDDSLAASAKE
jgi:hypothetical protein